ncbi:MAG: aldehyde dehydrogenase family protein [Bacteroidota bacterium]
MSEVLDNSVKPAPSITDTSAIEIQRIFDLQKEHQLHVGNSTAIERSAKLKALHLAILKYRPAIKEAMYLDYKKHPSEVDLTEVYPITSEIKYARHHIRAWMRSQKVATPFALLGSSSYVKSEAKGVVLIISPWNFPFNLTFGPLVGAIAAGNTVMIKPSEVTPHSSALMKKIIAEVFKENEIAVIEGGLETSTSLLHLPFNHIFFTGAPEIGKVVMSAAAKNLTSVTLELGGKSPTIIDSTANVKMAARRIAWAKFMNNGQICIAPDYVYVHKDKEESFFKEVQNYLTKFYADDAAKADSYSRIVNERHFKRLKGYLDDAISKGGQVKIGGQFDETQNFIAPTIITNVSEESSLMVNEIFGPILPVFTFTDLDKVIQKINEREKPLSLYIYSKSRKNINQILNNTRAGGTCINHSVVHFFNHNLPFGGSNNSGIGKAHGYFSFQEFSNPRGVLKQHIPNAIEILMMPYTKTKQKIIDLTIKWF